MKKINPITIILLLAVLSIAACNNGSKQAPQVTSTEKPDGQKLVEAYQKQDWETIVSIGDTLLDEKDTKNITIPYAEALAAVGNPQKAIEVLNRKLEFNPDDYYLYQTKGNVYYAVERFDSAIINYEIVISMKPTYARPYIKEGEIYEICGDKQNAIENYLAALRLFLANNLEEETVEFANRILRLDSTNAEARKVFNLK